MTTKNQNVPYKIYLTEEEMPKYWFDLRPCLLYTSLEELPAGLAVLVNQNDLAAGLGDLDGGGKARGARADDYRLRFSHASSAHLPKPFWVSTFMPARTGAVSYTHLDVYKRQDCTWEASVIA